MKKELLTVKELAAELRMSPKSIQRAYRNEEFPMVRYTLYTQARAEDVCQPHTLSRRSSTNCTRAL